ncbi:hypothetical protein GPECTOR_4g893 [Gonium pectorale]|uniref:Peptidase M14 domain-containing protein n=1 Tax=Gonium pectorale TaxID=33097 RepID=A0A150GYN2_GONPE|nr:hypothetical protein GPECTOR_4g893 [Gonium pectorale]|eukprot:KXZ54822.1 hypothetical protein GPECTOR_4g893 [Gonium pectorale]
MLAFLQKVVSVQGRQIVAVVAGSDSNSSGDGLPPSSFTWIGNMHGDETANRELLLRLADGMCGGALAAGDPRWRALQDSTVVRIIPSMNPDGFATRRRNNANNIDLNRNFLVTGAFPYPPPQLAVALSQDQRGQPLHPAAWGWAYEGNSSLQPEAVAVSAYLSAHMPDLSANLHGGSLVANYPLDACDSLGDVAYCPTADEPVPRLLAAAYAAANPGMTGSGSSFVNGSTQGAAWYPVLGSMQDWTYYALQRLQLTLELHSAKDPPPSALPGLWDANVRAMLRLMELAHMGLRGRVVDETTRGSLSANVGVSQPAGVRGTTADASRGGYFFKPMAPGLEYVFVVQPYDPADAGVPYEAITLNVTLGLGSTEDVMRGAGLQGLTVERLLLAVRSNPTTRKL